MAIRRPPRLELNRHGVFVVRLVIPAAHRDAAGRPRDIRVSLRTRDPVQARILALELNTRIELFRLQSPAEDPRILLLQHQATHGGHLGVPHPADQGPDVEGPHGSRPVGGQAHTGWPQEPPPSPAHPPSGTKLGPAIEAFVRSRGALANNRKNTGAEKQRALSMLAQFLRERSIEIDKVPAAAVSRPMLIDFVEVYAAREGKSGSAALSARTVLKQVGHLREFFDYLVGHADIQVSPMDTHFDKAIAGMKARAGQLKGRRNYRPFADTDLKIIFEPQRYLQHNSASDDFWLPLLGLFTGARLGELVVLEAADVGVNSVSGVRVLTVAGKNENSRRAVSIAQPLIDLGFLDYVDHVKKLGAVSLFPHRATNPTRDADPSKHASRAFGEHLDRVGLTDPLHVFHSLRHTVVSRLHVCGVPVWDAELVVGHAPQAGALRSDTARSHSGRSSVHLGTYSHPEAYTVAGEHVMARLKRRLDESLNFDLDFGLMARAAEIVLEHTSGLPRRSDGEPVFRSGWHTNAKALCARAMAGLDTQSAGALPAPCSEHFSRSAAVHFSGSKPRINK